MKRTGVIGIALLTAACGAGNALSSHQDLWRQKQPAAYSYTFATTGAALDEQLHVTVRGGQVTETTAVGSTTSNREGKTVEQLFGDVEQRLGSACKVSAEYDQTLGYPKSVYSDCGQEGDGWTVSGFSVIE